MRDISVQVPRVMDLLGGGQASPNGDRICNTQRAVLGGEKPAKQFHTYTYPVTSPGAQGSR
jgi:hypothetical protein